MEYWFAEQEARLRNLPSTKRYLYEKIDWSARCLGILGARGTENHNDATASDWLSAGGGKSALRFN